MKHEVSSSLWRASLFPFRRGFVDTGWCGFCWWTWCTMLLTICMHVCGFGCFTSISAQPGILGCARYCTNLEILNWICNTTVHAFQFSNFNFDSARNFRMCVILHQFGKFKLDLQYYSTCIPIFKFQFRLSPEI